MTKVPESFHADYEKIYVNKGYTLEFFHVPSGKMVSFKAMITNYEDRFSSEWNKEPVYGRMDPIQTFQGTTRTISLGWDVVAASVEDSINNLKKITLLMAMLYPAYNGNDSNASSISAAPLFRLAFSNLIKSYGNIPQIEKSLEPDVFAAQRADTKDPALNFANWGKNTPVAVKEGSHTHKQSRSSGLVGSIGGFTYNPNFDVGMFDTPDGKIYPKMVNLVCEFTVVHTHPLGWDASGEFRNPNFPYGETVEELEKVRKGRRGGKGSSTRQINSAKQNAVLNIRGKK